MSFAGFPPVYTPPAAAENAFAGKVLASADWNAIFTDIQSAINSLAQSLQTTSGRLMAKTTVTFSTSSTDFSFTVPIPTSAGFSRYLIESIRVSGASATTIGATVALFSAAGGAGTQILTSTATTVNTAAENTNGNAMTLVVANQSVESFNFGTLFFRVMAGIAAASTATVTLYIAPCS